MSIFYLIVLMQIRMAETIYDSCETTKQKIYFSALGKASDNLSPL
jgi:hypothetical protein